MPLRIPDGYSNWHIDFFNTNGGASQRSSVGQGIRVTAPLTQTDVNRVANIFRDAFKVRWDDGWFVGPVHVVENDSDSMKVWDDVTSEQGTLAAQVYSPPAVAWVVSKQSGFLGKKNRGRMYLPGVQESAVGESGALDGAVLTSMQTMMTGLYTALNADAAIDSLVILHDESQGAIAPTTMSNYLVRDTVGTMRPRQRR